MADVNISKYRAQVVREGSTPASPGFVVSEGQNPVDPSGSGQTHLPVTIASASTGLSITESQVLGGAGTVAQYIRGDGSLADFPESSGGGSSVSYYLNGSVSQGTIGGVAYKELNKVPILGAGTDFTINADGYIASFITDAGDPNKLLIPAGNWNLETYFSASSSGGSPSFYVELYKVSGSTATLIASSSSAPELIAFGTSLNPYFSTLAVPETILTLTDRLAIRYYVTHSGRTITLHTENNHLCQVITTFTTGLTALNGLTTQVQFFAVGTSGTDFNIASATDTHTFNLPTASATNRGALSSADWTTFNNKQNQLNGTGFVKISGTTISYDNSTYYLASNPSAFIALTALSGTAPIQYNNTTGAISITQASGSTNGFLSSTDWNTFNNKTSNVGTVTSVAALTLGTSGTDLSSSVANSTTTPVITLNVPTASASNRGALSSSDWTTFNNKENAITAGTTAQYFRGDKTFQTLNTSVVPEGTNLYYTEARVNANTNVAANTAARHNAVTLGVTNGLSLSTQQLSLGLASSSANGALSSTDWTTFNNKQNALTNPVTGTGSGTTNTIPKFTGANALGNSIITDSGSLVSIDGNFRIRNSNGFNDSVNFDRTAINGLILNSSGNLILNGSTGSSRITCYGDGYFSGGVQTGLTTGASSSSIWLLGQARGGTVTTNATVRVEIGGVLVDLVARYV